jgi:uncharacterized protein (TIGR03083 family)
MKASPRYEGPVIISISGLPDDQLVPVTRQRRRLETLVTGLSDYEWTAPSRCHEWTVQDVVAHVVGVNVFWQASVLAGLAGAPTRILVGFDPAATPARMVAGMRDLAPGDVLDQLVTSNDVFLGLLASLDDSGWSALAESPVGHVPIRLIAQHALWDSWIHERDIALPLGLEPDLEADEIGSCLRYAGALSPAFALTAGRQFSDDAFGLEASDPELSLVLDVGESVTVRDGDFSTDIPCLRGKAVTLVEALSLRTPLPASSPAEWRQVLAGLAGAFDVELPVG